MENPPNNPRAVIEIDRAGFEDGQQTVVWDSHDMPRLFKSVNVELVTNETSQAKWTFFDPAFKVIDAFSGDAPIPQATIRVYLGYGQDLGEPVFKGILAQVERGPGDTTFTAFDMGFKMKLLKRTGYKNRRDDIAVIRELAQRNGLQFEGPETPLKLEPHNAMMQDEQTDWEHVLERARDAGLVVFVREDTLFAKYPARTGTPAIVMKNKLDFVMTREWDLVFRTPENQDGSPRTVTQRGRGKGGKRLEGQSDTGSRGRESVIVKRDVPGRASKKKLTRRAQAQKELEREHAFEARLETLFAFTGSRIDVRQTAEIEGVGKLFSGLYIADAVRHEFEPGRLVTNLELYRDIQT